jgi:hypothetical protein
MYASGLSRGRNLTNFARRARSVQAPSPARIRAIWTERMCVTEQTSSGGAQSVVGIMPDAYHALVWIDRHGAKIFRVPATAVERSAVGAHRPTERIEHKLPSTLNGLALADQHFLERVSASIADAGAVVITGPPDATTELMTHVSRRHPGVLSRISGVVATEHPTDDTLVTLARTYFHTDDPMCSQR